MKKDLIIFLGQSNMQGETEKLSETDVVENGWEYRYLSDELVPLRNPVGENIGHGMTSVYSSDKRVSLERWLEDTVLLAAHDGCTNMVPSFVRSYAKIRKNEVVAVHAAKGSTVISYWMPGSEGYAAIVSKTKAAVKKVGKENIDKILIVWLQGESDMIAKTSKAAYKEGLTAIKNGLFKDTGASVFGIIRVGHFSSVVGWLEDDLEERKKHDEDIIAAQEEICEKSEDFIMLTRVTDKLIFGDKKYLNPNVGGHYSALGQEIIGKYAGGNLAAYVMGKRFARCTKRNE